MKKINFDISQYSIEKQEYTIPCKGSNISLKLDKESARKIRNFKTNVYLFTKYLYPPVEKTKKGKTCVKRNQFAKDGCLKWKSYTEKKLEFKKQVLMVSILSIDESKDFEVSG